MHNAFCRAKPIDLSWKMHLSCVLSGDTAAYIFHTMLCFMYFSIIPIFSIFFPILTILDWNSRSPFFDLSIISSSQRKRTKAILYTAISLFNIVFHILCYQTREKRWQGTVGNSIKMLLNTGPPFQLLFSTSFCPRGSNKILIKEISRKCYYRALKKQTSQEGPRQSILKYLKRLNVKRCCALRQTLISRKNKK